MAADTAMGLIAGAVTDKATARGAIAAAATAIATASRTHPSER